VREARARSSELGRAAAAKGSELGRSAASRGAEARRTMRQLDVPWARCRFARMLREAILQFGSGRSSTCTRAPTSPDASASSGSGTSDPRGEPLQPPGTPTILRALPRSGRQRTAVAAAADYFYNKRAVANAVALIFNTVPILRRGGGGVGNGAFEHVDRLNRPALEPADLPEGTRSREGSSASSTPVPP